jgi:hypothetical protein
MPSFLHSSSSAASSSAIRVAGATNTFDHGNCLVWFITRLDYVHVHVHVHVHVARWLGGPE